MKEDIFYTRSEISRCDINHEIAFFHIPLETPPAPHANQKKAR
jgi:hypothetical protein